MLSFIMNISQFYHSICIGTAWFRKSWQKMTFTPDRFSKNCRQKIAKGEFSGSFDETSIYDETGVYFIICNSTHACPYC